MKKRKVRDDHATNIDSEILLSALQTAEIAAKKAGHYLINLSDRTKIIKDKSSRDQLLRADLEAEKIIINCLQRKFPDYTILSEEKGLLKTQSRFRWVIDPLDGSFNFQHGDILYGVIICMEFEEVPVLATIYIPEQDEMYSAIKGRGATRNGSTIHVSETKTITLSRVQFGDFSKKDETISNKEQIRDMKRLASLVGRIRMVGSAAIDFVQLASGIADAMVVRHMEEWELAAGCLLVKEAGGIIATYRDSSQSILYLLSNRNLYTHLESLFFKPTI